MNAKTTPLIQEHKKLGARTTPFGGWLMPTQYEGIIAEHNWTRKACSLFDICHMGEFIIHGDSVSSGLGKVITVNLKNMERGSCRYGFLLSNDGGIIDDAVIYKINDDEWMLVVNAATIDSDQAHLKKHLGRHVEFENVSNSLGKLDLQGPLSQEVLQGIVGDGIVGLRYYQFGYFNILGQNCIVSRTGYTGELGYEIYISTEKVVDLWNLLLKDERVHPAGLGSRDTLRLEMGYCLYGQDIDRKVTPDEAGLEKFLDFDKDFIGKKALLKKRRAGIKKRLACFIAQSRRSPRHNYKIYTDGKNVGVVTSGLFSPSLCCGIAMGYINPEFNVVDSRVMLKDKDIEISAIITRKPFCKKII